MLAMLFFWVLATLAVVGALEVWPKSPHELAA
jgi:hypothetical protein